MQESQKAIQLKELTLASTRLKLKSDGAVRITLDYKFNKLGIFGVKFSPILFVLARYAIRETSLVKDGILDVWGEGN